MFNQEKRIRKTIKTKFTLFYFFLRIKLFPFRSHRAILIKRIRVFRNKNIITDHFMAEKMRSRIMVFVFKGGRGGGGGEVVERKGVEREEEDYLVRE